MYRVLFNASDEFIEELRKNRAFIDGGIVRTTGRQTSSATVPIRHLNYIASAVVCLQPGIPSFVMVLERYCGQILGPIGADDPAKKALDLVGEMIESVIAELLLEHRHGVIELAEKI